MVATGAEHNRLQQAIAGYEIQTCCVKLSWAVIASGGWTIPMRPRAHQRSELSAPALDADKALDTCPAEHDQCNGHAGGAGDTISWKCGWLAAAKSNGATTESRTTNASRASPLCRAMVRRTPRSPVSPTQNTPSGSDNAARASRRTRTCREGASGDSGSCEQLNAKGGFINFWALAQGMRPVVCWKHPSPSQPYLVLRDTLCSCEAYGMRPT